MRRTISTASFVTLLSAVMWLGCGDDDLSIPDATDHDQTVHDRRDQPPSDVDSETPIDAPIQDVAGDIQDAGLDTHVPVDEPPRLISAVIRDGGEVLLRFSEAMDPASAGRAENYQIESSGLTSIPITAARSEEHYVYLTLNLSGYTINPAYTYQVLARNLQDLSGNALDPAHNRATISQPLYLAIIWHQHQPLYHDPNRDVMSGPWVRKHATKDYWDMTAILRDYPDIHLTVNLTSVLIAQNEWYVERLAPYVDPIRNTVNEERYFAEMVGHTDAFIDLLLRDTPTRASATEEELDILYAGPWATVSTADATMRRFPEYIALRDGDRSTYDQMEFAYLKIFFELAWFDPDFLHGPVNLTTDNWVVDLSDVVDYHSSSGTFTLNTQYTSGASSDAQRLERLELLANRLVAENYKIMADVVPLHRELMYNPDTGEGQIEIITTPYFHPILPLIYNTDLARHAQPTDHLPTPPFSFPDDAHAQVALARQYYFELFGQPLRGMWPAEGSVAQEIVHVFADNNLEWVATDQRVLERSTPSGPHHFPYLITADRAGGTPNANDSLIIVFRDTRISDDIGFVYQYMQPRDAVNHFMGNVMSFAPAMGQPDRLLTVILDGENCWELFIHDHDGKEFLHTLYSELTRSQNAGELVTVNPTQYIHGHLERDVPPHPILEQRRINTLWRGSWIDASYHIWIGESEENIGWNYLNRARSDLELIPWLDASEVVQYGIPRPNPLEGPPDPAGTYGPSEPSYLEQFAAYNAYMAIYAAEGSDWFWWFGDDMTSPANDDTPFCRAFRSHLTGMYRYSREWQIARFFRLFPQCSTWPRNVAGLLDEEDRPASCTQAPMLVATPDFAPIVQQRTTFMQGPFTVEPTIDGQFLPDETEWSPPAGAFFDHDSSGVALSASDHFQTIYFGYNQNPGNPNDEAIYVAVVFNKDLSALLQSNYSVRLFTNYKHILDPSTGSFEPNPQVLNDEGPNGTELLFLDGGAGHMIEIDFSGSAISWELSRANGDNTWTILDSGGPCAAGNRTNFCIANPIPGGRLLEMRIPWNVLGMAYGDPFEFMLVASEGEAVIDQAPNLEAYIMFDDITNLCTVIFEVDVTGSQIPINQYVNIATPPPPHGTGLVFITGNQPNMGDWYPNFLTMRDDGVPPDRVANDGIWTRSFQLRPGLILRWKYTMGTPSDEGRWPNTEEYPLTERGFTLPTSPAVITISEIFADRPQPTGTTAPNSVITIE